MRIVLIIGTRPEAIKMAPVVHQFRQDQRFSVTLVVTGQHREMLDPFLKIFDLSPDWDLNLMRENQSLAQLSAKALEGLDQVFQQVQPHLVLVQGDTTTAFMGALSAYYRRIAVGHIEAGLRTGDKFQPFPEEINRRLIGAVADLHFAPTRTACDNLLREGIRPHHIFITGNTVVDALLMTLDRLGPPEPTPKRLLLVTAHRRENWGEPLHRIARALRRIAESFPEVQILFPIHKNPIVRQAVAPQLEGRERILVTEPPDYWDFVQWMRSAYLIITDSGGIQEEAPTLGKPVLVLRDKTERPEAVAAGVVKVIGTDEERIVAEVSQLLTDEAAYRRMQRPVNPYGDGKAARRIVQAVGFFFGLNDRPEDFCPPLNAS
ncbi:MAG: UDP-N-acetylglucosamine 2-epimerase (non-hydrolyzing) [Armatimonadetes bacterium]|nr:UDP-N-acetylglucosamine 2-epimerase (non-hydrolyzing) [Armatimonadota bacterium]